MATKKKVNEAPAKRKRAASSGAQKQPAQKKGTAKKNKPKRDWYIIYLVALFAISLLLSIFVYVDTESGGVVNELIRNLIFGLFGWSGRLVPICFIGYFLYLVFNRNIKRMWLKLVQTTLALSALGALIGLNGVYKNPIDAFYDGYTNLRGGGYIGALLGGFSEHMFQVVISYIAFSVILVILISYIVNLPLRSYLYEVINTAVNKANYSVKKPKKRSDSTGIRKKRDARRKADYEDYEEYEENIPNINENDYDYDNENDSGFFGEFFGIKSKKKSEYLPEDEYFEEEKPSSKKKSRKAHVEPESDSYDDDDFFDDVFKSSIDEVFGDDVPETDDVSFVDKTTSSKTYKSESESVDEKKDVDNKQISEPVSESNVEKAKREPKPRADKITESEKRSFSEELNSALNKTPVQYEFPPMELLDEAYSTSSDMRLDMRRTAENLISVLADFGVKARLLQVTQGPAVTRYEIQPDTGTKLSKITGLAEDIALNLAVPNVLVAPVPGKAAIGIEIPNKKVSPVTIREILESPEFTDAKSSLTVGLGKDIGGNVVVGNIAKWPHILIAGQTGSGKSVCINTIITSILYKASPEDVKLIMIDPKVVELSGYNGIPHLLIPVVSDPKKAAGALNWAVTEMMRRYDLFKNTGVRKLEGYNKLMSQQGMEQVPQIVIIIDELADLMMVAAKEVEDYICRLAQLARAAGIHLIISTQRPSVDVITGLIKANVPSRIAFSVASQVDSRTILDKGGADKLLGTGDMLYYPTGARSAVRVQGAFVSDDEIERIIDFIKDSVGEAHYSAELEEEIQKCTVADNSSSSADNADDGDELLQEAIKLAVDLGKISTSMVQRRLGVGYARAGRIIDQMEARGIISGSNGSKPRDVLISHADLAGVGNDSDMEDKDDEE